MHKTTIIAALAVATVSALSGCGATSAASPAPTATVTVTVTEMATPTEGDDSAETSTTSSVPAVQTFKIGEKAKTSIGTFAVISNVKSQTIDDGSSMLYAQAFKAQICIDAGAEKTPVRKDMWRAADKDSGEYEPSTLSVFDELQPELPDGYDDADSIAPGTCVTGWVGFDVKPTVKLTAAVLHLTGGNQYRWPLS